MNDKEIIAQLKETGDVSLAIQEYRKEHNVSDVYAKATLRELIKKSHKLNYNERVDLLHNELLQPSKSTVDWKSVIIYVIGIFMLIVPFILLFCEYGFWEGLGILMGTYLAFEFFMGR